VSEEPLRQDVAVDEPGMVGARWWQDSVVDPVGRRQMLFTMLAAGAGVGVGAAALAASDPTRTARRAALDLQRQYGWSFGASAEGLVFNGVSTEPFDRSRLDRMVAELAPRSSAHRPFYVPTLFEAPAALPRAVAEGDPGAVGSLRQSLVPISTTGMREAFAWADRYARWLAQVPGACLVVDLNGPESVAFAAGASGLFDPVFLFDNWPHPHGVVAAHLTLAAAAYYQPMFARAGPNGSPPMFVLDRQRLAPYRDDAAQFDNRWVARMPNTKELQGLGARTVFYVVPSLSMPCELDDLNDDFVSYALGGFSIVALDTSIRDADGLHGPADVATSLGATYLPMPRRTPFSSGHPGAGRPVPDQFGSVPVVLSALGGTLLGVAWSRSGSWNRGWGGGG
jgi:hypothetical protein